MGMQAIPGETLLDRDQVRGLGEFRPACRFCGAGLRHTFVDLGMSPLCESYVPADRVNAMEPFYPLHAKVCESCLLVQLEAFVTADDDLQRVRVLLLVLGFVGRARRQVRRDGGRAVRARREQPRRWSSPATTGICSSTSWQRGIPALGIEPAGERRRRGAREGHRDDRRVLRPGAGRLGSPPKGRAADLLAANNVMAHVPDLNDFVGGIGIVLAPRGRRDDRGPAPAAPGREQPVRHDLPRALLVFLAADRAQGARGPRPRALRRRRAEVARRFAAPLRPARRYRPAAGESARGRARRAGARPRLRHARGPPARSLRR